MKKMIFAITGMVIFNFTGVSGSFLESLSKKNLSLKENDSVWGVTKNDEISDATEIPKIENLGLIALNINNKTEAKKTLLYLTKKGFLDVLSSDDDKTNKFKEAITTGDWHGIKIINTLLGTIIDPKAETFEVKDFEGTIGGFHNNKYIEITKEQLGETIFYPIKLNQKKVDSLSESYAITTEYDAIEIEI